MIFSLRATAIDILRLIARAVQYALVTVRRGAYRLSGQIMYGYADIKLVVVPSVINPPGVLLSFAPVCPTSILWSTSNLRSVDRMLRTGMQCESEVAVGSGIASGL